MINCSVISFIGGYYFRVRGRPSSTFRSRKLLGSWEREKRSAASPDKFKTVSILSAINRSRIAIRGRSESNRKRERGNGDKESQAKKENIKFHQFANRRLPIQFLSRLAALIGGCNGTIEVCMMQEKKKERALEWPTSPYVCLGFQVLLMIDRGISTSPLWRDWYMWSAREGRKGVTEGRVCLCLGTWHNKTTRPYR